MSEHDNSRLEALEAAVNKSEDPRARLEVLEAVLDSFDNCVVVSDPKQPDNPIIYVNRTFEQFTGYSFAEATGQNCRFLQAEDRNQPGLKPLRNGLANRAVTKTLLRNYRKNGEMFWNELYVSPVRDRNNELIYFVGVQNDVTQRENLAADRALLEAAIMSAAESVVITDAGYDGIDHRIVMVNPAFSELTGYSSEEVKGLNPRFLQGEKTNPVVIDRLRQALKRGTTFQGETVNYKKDGSEYLVEWTVTPIRLSGAEDADVDYWVATQRDVTWRRELEKQVLAAADEESRRLARDLHDSVVQEMIGTGMLASQALKLLPDLPENEAVRKTLEETKAQIKLTTQETRSLSHRMYGLNLEGGGLMRSLAGLASNGDRGGASVSFYFENPLVMQTAESAEHIYRIAQEAVSNAVRHAGAKSIQIGLSNHLDCYTLTVRDNGGGLAELKIDEGMGMRNMHYRANELGGDLDVKALDQGTLVSLRFKAK